ncbi:hypothetical protein I5S62_08290 [Pseudomonas putida]|uniref:Uncharacterized protein n=2 Tax=Pseudomonas putida TaxID=303 RepID=A0A1X0ZD03_PSEPU|nr:hypothetical protein [Pseudomonas putida]ELU0815568.1 hypothetical protein [Pseudomonas putida]KAF0253523.1 hypothetical protein GN299_17905 [Pseudomonas putida]KWW13879.1 hypothetical protein AS889_19755 [Pseudomonas putida]MBH3349993.1 hypothetical protein [Pseudomonas putida]MBH3389121.1 hypothetical protein [Pseudomonas putida]
MRKVLYRERVSVLKGVQMAFRAFAVVGLCSAIFQPALAGDDKNRVFVAKRWYTESYVREYIEKNHPSIFRDIFSKQMSYNFAADGPPPGIETYNYYAKPKSIREGDFLKWKAAGSGRSLEAELDKLCVLEVSGALAKLKGWIRNTVRMREVKPQKGDLDHVIVAAVRSGQLSRAPLNLDQSNKNSISPIPPEGPGRLLCNLYATRKSNEVIYHASVALTAEGFYYGSGR